MDFFQFEILYFISLIILSISCLKKEDNKEIEESIERLFVLKKMLIFKEYKKLVIFFKRYNTSCIFQVLFKASLKGISSEKKIRRIINLLLESERIILKNNEIKKLLIFRMLLIITFSLSNNKNQFFQFFFIRVVISKTHFLGIQAEKKILIDTFILIVSFICSLLSFFLIEKINIRPWFWKEGLSDQGKRWLFSYILNDSTPKSSYFSPLIEREKDCKLSSNNIQDEKKVILEMFAWKKNLDDQQKQNKVFDILPLIELLAYGLPCLLLLSQFFLSFMIVYISN